MRLLLFLATVTLALGADEAAPGAPLARVDAAVLRTKLTSVWQVVELENGRAAPGLPFLTRMEVFADRASVTLENSTGAAKAARLTLQLYNAYGMQLATARIAFEPIAPGQSTTKEVTFAVPNLDAMFAKTSLRFPKDWRDARFIAVWDETPVVDTKNPRPRPEILKRPAILAPTPPGTSGVGVAMDPKWKDYGAYLQRMIDTVQIEWERLLLARSVTAALGTRVSVKFAVNDQGRVVEIAVVETTANENATRACVSAITNRNPYGAWTAEMRAVLGAKQEITFTFHYQ